VGNPLSALMDLGELAYGDQIVWSGVEHAKKLRARIVETVEFK